MREHQAKFNVDINVLEDRKLQVLTKEENLEEREQGLDEWNEMLENDQKEFDQLLDTVTSQKEILLKKDEELQYQENILAEKEKILYMESLRKAEYEIKEKALKQKEQEYEKK